MAERTARNRPTAILVAGRRDLFRWGVGAAALAAAVVLGFTALDLLIGGTDSPMLVATPQLYAITFAPAFLIAMRSPRLLTRTLALGGARSDVVAALVVRAVLAATVYVPTVFVVGGLIAAAIGGAATLPLPLAPDAWLMIFALVSVTALHTAGGHGRAWFLAAPVVAVAAFMGLNVAFSTGSSALTRIVLMTLVVLAAAMAVPTAANIVRSADA